MSHITAVIPVKAHSVRLKDKNILPYGNSNLLIHKIRQLKQVSGINEIVVSSDSDVMLEMSEKEGVLALKRPYEFANESKPFGEFIEYLCDNIQCEHLVYACATSPLADSAFYSKALQLYFDNLDEYDSLITVLKMQIFLFDEHGPFNFEPGLKHTNSEKLPLLYHFTNSVNIAPREEMKKWKYNFGPKAYRMEVDKRTAVDIDDIYDYEIAKALQNVEI